MSEKKRKGTPRPNNRRPPLYDSPTRPYMVKVPDRQREEIIIRIKELMKEYQIKAPR